MGQDTVSLMVDIIKETIGDQVDEDTALVLIYILYNFNIYFLDNPQSINSDYPFEATLRAACQIVSNIVGDIEEYGVPNWYSLYLNIFDNPYEIPSRYEQLSKSIIERLSAHSWVDSVLPSI